MAVHYRYPDNYMREGIDTITLEINSIYVKDKKWWWHTKKNEISLRKVSSEFCVYYYIDFQEEAFPKNYNYLMIILLVLGKLILADKIDFCGNWVKCYNILEIAGLLVKSQMYKKIATLDRIDFHFDFKKLETETKGQFYDNVVYSPDHRSRHASECIRYNRKYRELKKRGIKNESGLAYKRIMAMEFPIRFEFRFIRNDNFEKSKMHLDILDTNYEGIFNLFCWHMAKILKKNQDILGRPEADSSMYHWNYLTALIYQKAIHNYQRIF